jgi:hypothetical protein
MRSGYFHSFVVEVLTEWPNTQEKMKVYPSLSWEAAMEMGLYDGLLP